MSSTSASSGLSKLAIIHTNDTHGFDQAADGVLGMSAVAQLKKDYAEMGYEVLLFDVGDALSGSLLADDSQGKAVAEFETGCYLANIGIITYENGKFSQTLVAAGEYEGGDAKPAEKIDSVAAGIDEKLSKKVGTTPFMVLCTALRAAQAKAIKEKPL